MKSVLFLSIALLSVSCSKEKEQEKVEVEIERTCNCKDSISGMTVSYDMKKNTLVNHKKECEGMSMGTVTCDLK